MKRIFFILYIFACLIPPMMLQAGDDETPSIEALKIYTKFSEHEFKVEVAESHRERKQGLMGRESLKKNTGMLFNFGRTSRVAMWMKDTPLSLDMVFISEKGKILRIEPHTKPFSLDAINSGAPVLAVLEIPAGTTNHYGIKEGDVVKHRIFGNVETASSSSAEPTIR